MIIYKIDLNPEVTKISQENMWQKKFWLLKPKIKFVAIFRGTFMVLWHFKGYTVYYTECNLHSSFWALQLQGVNKAAAAMSARRVYTNLSVI